LRDRRYRLGFVLGTGSGNHTRYVNLRKYAERDPTVECLWALDPGGPPARSPRLRALAAAGPVLRELPRLDAVMFHAFEPYVLGALRNLVRPRPLLLWSKDDAPSADPRLWWHYGLTRRPAWRARLRFELDRLCARRVRLFFPFSRRGGEELVACGAPRARVHPLNVGVDLETWRYTPRGDARPPKILFVGGNFVRKGGDLLVDVFRRRFAGRAELHLVTSEPPRELPPGATVHALGPGDPRLHALYAEAALLALPTRADFVPQVILEAMAAGAPVVATRVGGIPDLVDDGATGVLIPPDDGGALAAALDALLADPALRRRMGDAGRARVERELDARVNVARMLALIKREVDHGLT
jgi:glycosyltransferase involved in cell wall biosynthesis